MEIRIDGQLATLKKGASFEFVSENRLFSGSDEYTMSITLPLRGCKPNLKIFGHLNRHDVNLKKRTFNCEIRHRGFVRTGAAVIVEINEVEIKVQFLGGRSVQNFDQSFDETYIDQLTLGPIPYMTMNDISPKQAWDPERKWGAQDAVALPWVRADSGNIMNLAVWNGNDNVYYWDSSNGNVLSWQPYLLAIAKKICSAVNYTYDFSVWENSDTLKYLLVCNSLPGAWYSQSDNIDYASLLPHWTVQEFFEKLELFIGLSFTISTSDKTIVAKDQIEEDRIEPVILDKVVEEHTVAMDKDPKKNNTDYIGAKNIGYADGGHQMDAFYNCDWYFNRVGKGIQQYDTVKEAVDDLKVPFEIYHPETNDPSVVKGFDWTIHKLNPRLRGLRCTEGNCCFIPKIIYKEELKWQGDKQSYNDVTYFYYCTKYHTQFINANLFPNLIVDQNNADDIEEIEFVPVCIDITEWNKGDCMFITTGDYKDTPYDSKISVTTDENWQFTACNWVSEGEKNDKESYFDKIFVAFWDGTIPQPGFLPFPYITKIWVTQRWNIIRSKYSLSLTDGFNKYYMEMMDIDTRMKYTFKFLADDIPNPRAVFYIRGKRYLCAKLTAQCTDTGMSDQITGEFYRLQD